MTNQNTITIKEVVNGWKIIRNEDETVYEEIFQVRDDDEDEQVAFQELLYRILQLTGPNQNNYSNRTINIEIKPGSKFEDFNEKGAEQVDVPGEGN